MADDDALSRLRDDRGGDRRHADGLGAHLHQRVARGLKDAVIDGHGLMRLLRTAALSLSNSALTARLRPLTNLVERAERGGRQARRRCGGRVAWAATKLVPFAEGGVIGAPTTFGLGGGRTGLMGEAGREAILPLARGTDGRLGVAVEGAGGGSRVTINVKTPDAESFRRSEAQMTAMLARAVGRGRRGL